MKIYSQIVPFPTGNEGIFCTKMIVVFSKNTVQFLFNLGSTFNNDYYIDSNYKLNQHGNPQLIRIEKLPKRYKNIYETVKRLMVENNVPTISKRT